MLAYRDKSRIWQLDLLKLFACFLVVWGHVISNPNPNTDNSLWRIIYSFHVSLFMMISGYFALSTKETSSYNFFKKKFMQLLYPCFIWGCVSFLFSHGYSLLKGEIQFLSLKKILSELYWLSDFWFLKSCFICLILTHLGIRHLKNFTYFSIATLFISQFISLYQVPFMYPAFYIGFLIRRQSNLLSSLIKIWHLILLAFIIMSSCWTKDVWIACHDVPFAIAFNSNSSTIGFLAFRLFRLSIGITGALSFFLFFVNTKSSLIKSVQAQHLCSYGQYTLEIYVISAVLFGNVKYLLASSSTIPELFNYYIFAPFLSSIIIIASVFIAKLLFSNKKTSYFFWGRLR